MKIQDKLQACIDDPMWVNHAEVNKSTLKVAVDTIKVLERDASRFKMMQRLADSLGEDNDPAGLMEDAAEEIAGALEEKHGQEYAGKHPGQMLAEMLDLLMVRFPEAP